MADARVGEIEDAIASDLDTQVGRELSARSAGWHGLKWAPNMPDDDPDSDFRVVDEQGNTYELTIDVFLTPVHVVGEGGEGELHMTTKPPRELP